VSEKKEYKYKPSMTTYSKMGELKTPPKVKLKIKKVKYLVPHKSPLKISRKKK
tara:strand:- start:7610 stop:7768 length:159 start_codon:yes stop_codon:yes gene_type:complete